MDFSFRPIYSTTRLAESDTRRHILGTEDHLVSTSLVVSRLAESEGDVAVLDHVLNLSSHYTIGASAHSSISEPARPTLPGYGMVRLTRQAKKYNEIYHQHRPKHWHIKYPKPRTNERYSDRPRT